MEYGNDRLVYILKDSPSPDPLGLLLWGYEKNGGFLPGDYKGKFEKTGKVFKIQYSIGKNATANQEKMIKNEAIVKFLLSKESIPYKGE